MSAPDPKAAYGPDFDAGKITQHLFVAVRIAGALASASALLLPGAAGPRRAAQGRWPGFLRAGLHSVHLCSFKQVTGNEHQIGD